LDFVKLIDMKLITDKEYPRLLKETGKDAPGQLYYKGNWDSEIFENCLAVVGSRQMTSYGKRVVEQIVTEVAAAGITIVSGFMFGIDAQAHKAALQGAGRTVAVMPCGIDLIHPEYQEDLYKDILSGKGLIVSEYEGKTQPALWTYPKRNRIVAGLSKAVLIVEAGEKSGSLITAEYARKYKRKVFSVPGPIFSETSKGALQLIREGATMVSSARDILDFYRSSPGFSSRFTLKGSDASQKGQRARSGRSSESSLPLPLLEQQIIEQLQREPLEADELSRILNSSASKLGTTLSLMQLKGLIKQEGNKYYADR